MGYICEAPDYAMEPNCIRTYKKGETGSVEIDKYARRVKLFIYLN